MLFFRELLCKSLIFIFLQVSYIVREVHVSVVRERERNFLCTPTARSAFCRDENDCLYQLFSPMYYLPVACTFTIDFDQFEFQLMLDQNQSFAWIFRTSSPWNLETFIKTSGLQSLWQLVFRIFKSSEAGGVHQNFLFQNLQLAFWANYQSLQ